MAEYQISYKELSDFINQEIKSVKDEDRRKLLKAHEGELLCALTSNLSHPEGKDLDAQILLWNNLLEQPSKSVMGDWIVSQKDIVLAFVKVAISSGLLEAMLMLPDTPISLHKGIIIGGSIVLILYELFQKASKIDDCDFCVYSKIAFHLDDFKVGFEKSNIMKWCSGNTCNHSINRFYCEHKQKNKTCELDENDIENSLKSLCQKRLLNYDEEKSLYYII